MGLALCHVMAAAQNNLCVGLLLRRKCAEPGFCVGTICMLVVQQLHHNECVCLGVLQARSS